MAPVNQRLVVIEDDPDILRLLTINLGHLGYEVSSTSDGGEGLELILSTSPALIILDVMLPKVSGLEICQAIRERNIFAPVLMLTARAAEADKILGLELGADDYLTKPFSIGELTARVRALLRRSAFNQSAAEDGVPYVQYCGGGALCIDCGKRQASLHGEELQLTHKEFELLCFFAKNAGRTYTREQLLSEVWNYSFDGYHHTVTSHINRLRGKIEADPGQPRYILTVRGAGYRFATEEELAGDAAVSD